MALITVNTDTHPPARTSGHMAQVLRGNHHTNFLLRGQHPPALAGAVL